MRRTIVVLTVLASACSSPSTPPSDVAPPGVKAVIAHTDPRLDLPSFAWLRHERGAPFSTARRAAQASLDALAPSFRMSKAARAATELAVVHDLGEGPILVEYAQRVRELDVFRARLRIALSRELVPIAASGLLAPSLEGSEAPFVLDPRAAVSYALRALGKDEVPAIAEPGGPRREQRYTAPSLEQPARVRPVFFPLPGDRLEPAYYVEAKLRRGDGRSFVISAQDGRLLFENEQVRSEAATYRVYADPDTFLPYHSPYGLAGMPHPTGVPDGYRPSYAPSQLVTIDHYPFSQGDPWLAATTYDTSGNNVDAYADLVAPNGFTPSSADQRAPMTSPRAFDHSYDTGQSPSATPENIAASVTQMFYLMNFLHDWFYDAGFDEKSGNPQTDNFGRGGIGNDALRAEVQDYSGRNNANAYAASDGSPPQVQMYIFSGTSTASLEVTAPAPIAGTKSVGIAGFGSADSFNLAGTVVLGSDDTGSDVNDGCEALTNNVSGKIVLVHRGLCSFAQKVLNGQNAGAIGVLVANVASSADPTVAPFMGGTGDVSIPSLSLNLADGKALESKLPDGVSVVMHRSLQTDLDGALDTNVASHEWGHVLSGRLIGDGNGLNTNQAGGLGEGWSDFVALLLTSRPDQPGLPGGKGWSGVYPSGAYAMAGAGEDYYFGIRRVPYSADLSKDPLTFQHIADGVPLPSTAPISFGEDGGFNSEVHNTGEVWATMLWECYVGLLREKKVSFRDAQERMKRYLVASLKLTPVDPTLLEARDALLAAALATDEGDYRIFWKAFAKRGAGVGAVGPGKTSSDNSGVLESFAAGNDVQIVSATLRDDVVSCDHDGILDEGERGTVEVVLRNDGTDALPGATLVVSSATDGVKVDADGFSTLPAMAPTEQVTVKVGLKMQGLTPVDPILLDVMVVDPTLAAPRLIKLTIPTRFHSDEAGNSSTVDHVDTSGTSWLAQGYDGDTWERVYQGYEGWWKVVNSNLVSDHELRSEAFTIDGTTFSLSWRHRWSFRRSQRRMIDIDGGVVEVSTDDGETWTDAGDLGTIDYNTTLDAARMSNVLAGRQAYGNTSPGYPDEWVSSRADITLPSHPDTVRVRFRMGTAGGFTGAPGWEIDDIALEGISSTPFWSFVEHRDACDPAAPSANAGVGQDVRSGQQVSLNGSGGTGYHWTQVAGPFVALKDRDTATPTFLAPHVDDPTELIFALRVDDGALLSPPATVSITVRDGGGCSAAPGGPNVGETIVLLVIGAGVLLRRRRVPS